MAITFVFDANGPPDVTSERKIKQIFSTSFVEETVVKAPLSGTYFNNGRDTVHQVIVSFTAGENLENWFKKGYTIQER